MVYEDIFDAKNACDHLSGFNVCNRYLVVLYYNANRVRMVTFNMWWHLCNGTVCVFVICSYMCSRLVLSFFVNFAGFPKDGHKEKGGAAEASEREIWNQHRPSKVASWKHPPSFFLFYVKNFTIVFTLYSSDM